MRSAATPRDASAAATESDYAQAAYFLGAMRQEEAAISAEIEQLRAQLARCLHLKQVAQAERIQHDLRQAALQRREVLDIASAINRRFHPQANGSDRR